MANEIMDFLWGAIVGEIVGTVLLGGLVFAACNPEIKRCLPKDIGGGGEMCDPDTQPQSQRARAYPLKIDRDIRLL